MVARRMLLIVAILMGVTALTAGLAAPPSRRGAEPIPTPRSGAALTQSTLVERTLDASAAHPRTVAVEEGDQVNLTVAKVPGLDAVQLLGLGLGLVEATAPDTPAMFNVIADRPGTYPIVVLSTNRRVGSLRVTPAQE